MKPFYIIGNYHKQTKNNIESDKDLKLYHKLREYINFD